MKIADSNLQMSSTHAAVERRERRESLRYWEDGTPGRSVETVPSGREMRRLVAELQAERSVASVEISRQGRALQPKPALLEPARMDEAGDVLADLEVSLLKALLEEITGREFKLFNPRDLETKAAEAPETASPAQSGKGESAERQGWGLVYDYYESHYEAERMTFRTEGTVRTEDGKEISIDLELSMSREFFSEESLSIRAGDALTDPLVIDFRGTGAQLTQTRFSFDLDRDGREDQIAFVAPGSGFLALDKNGDGKVNDGGELFGPTSGNGFSELAAHDADANGWIDESDDIYRQLRIWSKDAEGNDTLVGLGQRGVGAIYLGHAHTPFALKDGDNALLGQVRSSGVFLREDGGAGLVQQVDLKV